jgi:hypothetical protein
MNDATEAEWQRIYELLTKVGAIRESRIPGFVVLYTETGAVDIPLARMKGQTK